VRRIVDAGVLLAAVALGFFLGRGTLSAPAPDRSLPARPAARSSLTNPIGQKLSLPGVDWQKNGRTLVFALQTGCRFCSESGPIYQRLAEQRKRFGDTRFVAVLPQTVEESKAFLDQLGVQVDTILQGSLANIGVRGTPTLLLVNSAGVVTEAWSGRLRPEAEQAVLARLTIR
jgi:hypothetical protein